MCVFLKGFYHLHTATPEKQRPLHQAAAALKYATDTMNEQRKCIIINITKSVDLLKQRYRTLFVYTGAQTSYRHFHT